MSDVQTWSTTAASNNSAAPNGFPEGMPPSGVNDAAREVMAAVARYREDTDGVNTSSGTDTITLSSSRTMTAYAQGDMYTFKAGGTNTGATTLNVDGLGAKDVQFNGTACTGGEIITDLMYTVVYDGTQFQLMNAASYPAIDIETLEVTNIKAKDGTAAATIANSTGKATFTNLFTVDVSAQGAGYPGIEIKSGPDDPAAIRLNYDGTAHAAFSSWGSLDDTYLGTLTSTKLKLMTNSTERVVINEVGATSITAADDTNAALQVTQTGTGNSLVVEDSANPDSTPFVIDNAGNVIVGHTAPINVRGIGGASQAPKSQVIGANIASAAFALELYTTTSSNGPQLIFAKSANATIGSFSASTAGDLLGAIVWNGVDSSNSDFRTACGIGGYCESVGADYTSGYIKFSTINTSGTLGERMRITADGTLDLRQSNTGLTSDAPLNVLRFTDTDATTAANQPIGKIEFYNSDTDNAAVGAYILSSAVGTAGGGTIRFGAAANAGAVAEIARVASTGLTVTASTAGLGYGTGSGGAVTQTTGRTTGVTLDKTNGAITLVSAAGSTSWQSFTVTNSTVAATDTVIVNQKSGTDLYIIHVTAVAAGSFRITFATTGGTTTEQPVFNFAVIKAVAA